MILQLNIMERLLHRLHLLPAPVMDTFAGVLFGRMLAVAVRRGVLEAAAEGPCSAPEAARRAGLDEQATLLLCEACVVAGYLRRTSRGYAPTPDARRWLLKESPRSLVHLVAYFETLHGRWQQLERALVHGRPERPYYEGFTGLDWETYALGMRDLARLLAPSVLRGIRLPQGEGRLLDVGGAHGLYSIECCRRCPGLLATVMDFPQALETARRDAGDAGMTGRLAFLPGDFMELPFPPGQDIVLLFNILHGFSREANRSLIRKALDALRPGGRLYILDQFTAVHKGSRVARFIPLMVGLNLLNEIGGTSYGMDDVREWCGTGAAVKRKRVGLPGVGLVEVVPGGYA